MAKSYNFEAGVLWMDGDNFLGQIKEVELPDIEWKTTEHETIGLMGTPEYPTKLEAFEITITPMGLCPGLVAAASNPFQGHFFQLRSNFGEYAGDIKTANYLYKVDFSGRITMHNPGNVSQEELETEYTVKATSIRIEQNGIVELEIDTTVPTYRSRGVDLIADWRQNLGV